MNLLSVFLNVGNVNIAATDNEVNLQYCFFNRWGRRLKGKNGKLKTP